MLHILLGFGLLLIYCLKIECKCSSRLDSSLKADFELRFYSITLFDTGCGCVWEDLRIKIQLKVCHDCMQYTLCPGAYPVITEDADTYTQEQFQDKFCGVSYVNGDRIPKVCCSDFNTAQNDNIDHPNIALLPKSCGAINEYPGNSLTAKLYEFPWLALLSAKFRQGEKFICDGVIVHSRYILTTASCSEGPELTHVRVGDYNPDTAIDCMPDSNSEICEDHIQDIPIIEIIKHPNYVKNIPDIRNNIALLRVKVPIDFSFRNVAPICLPIYQNLRKLDLINKTGTVAGWAHDGVIDLRNYGQLLKLQQEVQSENVCIAALSRLLLNVTSMENAFCVFTRPNSLCNTIGGDPFMIIHKYKQINRYILYGIYSHGTKECVGNTPEIFVDITKVLNWILENINP